MNELSPGRMLVALAVTFHLAGTVGDARADANQYRAAVQAEPSLLSFYPFDGDSGATATDRVAPLQHGTLVGATFVSGVGTVGSQSVQGPRVDLGPVADYEFSDGSGTVEVFLYQTSTAGNNPCFFSGRNSPAVRYSLHGDSAGTGLWIWNGATAIRQATPTSMLNQLVHVAYVFEGGNLTVYFNGAHLVTWDIPLGSSLGVPFQIGASGPSAAEGWPGRIDEVAVHAEPLPASAIAAHYAAWQTSIGGAAPVITQQPQHQALDAGQTATFSVELADATGVIYRWTRNGTNIPGATSATLVISPVTQADNNSILRCVVYNAFGGTNSIEAILAVRAPPSFIVPPTDTVYYISQPGSLSAVVAGSLPLSYQWFKNGVLIPNATAASHNFASLTPADSGTYALRVTNVFGAVTSAPAVLSVVPVVILNPPQNGARFIGQSVTLTVSAVGVIPLVYQWFKDNTPLNGQTSSTLVLGPLTLANAGAYSVTVSNPHGSTDSPAAVVTVLDVTTPQEIRSPPPFEWLPQENGVSADAVVLFNEIMYHPGPSDSPALQWIELFNAMRVDVDMSNWKLDGGIHYTFPANTIVPGGGLVLVAGDLGVFSAATGLPAPFGPFYTNLSNGGERIILRNHDGRMLDEMDYGDDQPWPAGADGSGATLSKLSPLLASAEPTHWVASTELGGTPGRANVPATQAPSLAINEIDSRTNSLFRMELLNHGSVPLALADFILVSTSTNGATSFSLPPSNLDPGQFVGFDSTQTGFQPEQNDRLFLLTSNANVLVDAATVKNQLRGRSPDGPGRWLRPTTESFGASNVVAVNRDIVINEIMYEAAPSYPSGVYAASDEEWIELFNRGTNPVDLTGWSLDGGIGYNFPASTFLAPGAYLVVAKDAPAMRAAHPGITVLGNFNGRLANKTDLIELKDADQRVVNEVRYYKEGRWPGFAAEGGSSLELIDPYADNRRAESWAASDESSRGSWQTVTYRAAATPNPGYDIGHNIWREFVLGLLDAGEFLLDDVSVVELPGTPEARELIQNGGFDGDAVGSSPAAWRFQGTHGQHGLTRIESDPSNPGNKVLRVHATGPTDFLQNHLETTLKSGGSIVSVVPGREYEISYRARWLGGSRLLNTRLYLKWLQRTTVLNIPASGGTPGAINSRRIASAGPTYNALSHWPVVPSGGANVTISINAYDPQDIAALTLVWRVEGDEWNSTPMTAQLPNAAPYLGTIPGQPAGTNVQFYVHGRDTVGGSSFYPAKGPDSRAMFTFNDGRALAAPNFNLRFVMTAADAAAMYYSTNRMSNHRLGATIIYNESEVFYDVGVRLKGSAFGRNNDSVAGLNIEFDPDQRFRGAHGTISIERASSKREILARHLFNQAGEGVVAGYDDIAQIITPRSGDVGRAFLSTTRTTDTMLDTQFGGGGTVYNLELLYTPTTTANGNPEAPKLNFPYVHTAGAPDIQDLGDDEEIYRWNFQVRNNRARDDFSLMMTVAKSFELDGASMNAQLRDVIDVDQWLRTFAMESLVGNDDFYTRFYNHNFRMYQRPDDNRLVALAWDLDRAFNFPTTISLWGTVPDQFGGTNRMRKIIEYPPNLRAYYGHLLDLIATCYNANYATYWANHYAALSGDGGVSGYATYIANRAAYVQSQIPTFPNFSITTSNGLDFTANTNLVTLGGSAPLAMRYASVNGLIFEPVWPSTTTWSLELALPTGTHELVVQALDSDRTTLETDTINVTVTAPTDDPVGRIVINEIHYNATLPGTEFVELINTSQTTAFDLGGWRLNGTGLTFEPGTILEPGAILVLPLDRLALSRAFGLAGPVVTEFPGRLDLDGETLSLIKPATSNSAEMVIDRVRYEPGAPWLDPANGQGQSLQLIDATQDNSRVSAWAAGADWRFFSLTANIGAGRLSGFFDTAGGDIYLDDLELVPGTQPGMGANLLVNAGFETPLDPAWGFSGIAASSHRTNGLAHSGNSSLHYVQVLGGPTLTTFHQDLPPVVNGQPYTLSGWYRLGNNGNLFTLRAGSAFQVRPSLVPPGPTPGAANLGMATLPAYPPLWLNEVQPLNLTGLMDGAGQRDPWVEIYNAGPDPVSLDGFFLSSGYVNLAEWAFPAGTVVAPQQFLVVWTDGEPGQGNAAAPHTTFRLGAASRALALSRSINGAMQIVDYLNFDGLDADESYGSVPDGQPFYRQAMFFPTPGAPNTGASAPVTLFINEWMASNTGFIRDPADNDTDDWFEIYNPNAFGVDLGDHFLTDNLDLPTQYRVPDNGHYVIPAGGHLLVWADGETGQNSTNILDLHVNFSLRAAGEAIGLYAPDGRLIDAVTFTNQTENISMGRSPDGSGNVLHLPVPSPGEQNSTTPSPPVLIGVAVSGADVTLSFTTQPGSRYRVQFKHDLDAAAWSDLPDDISAPGTISTKTDTNNGAQRFYRILAVP